MKECQFQALLTLSSSDEIETNGVVFQVDCAEHDRHVRFSTSKEFLLVFPKTFERMLLAELCKDCECVKEDAHAAD